MPAPAPSSAPDPAERLARLEARVARLETFTGIDDEVEAISGGAESASLAQKEDELEQEVGQKWFARFGIVALAVGGGYMLTQPYPGAPAMVPGMVGLLVSLALFVVARLARKGFSLVSSYLRGAAMALLLCATLRLSFFGPAPILPPAGLGAHLTIIAAAIANLAIGWRRRSGPLLALAIVGAAVALLALGDATTFLCGYVALAGVIAWLGSRKRWSALLPLGAGVLFLSYAEWAMGNPLGGGAYHWLHEPRLAPLVLLVAITVIASVPLWTTVSPDHPAPGAVALLNCLVGYGAFLVHTYAMAAPSFASAHVVAAGVFLWLAAILWRRFESQIATFFYAMCAYAALTVAIVKLTTVPNVFVWLSLESVVVVATAIWFRSRFIVVTNFVIYVVVVLGYIVLNEHESGVSIGFGLVALVSARILNWQRHRLVLKTDFMRNAYLVSALVVFPYALFHLATPRYAGFAWVGLSTLYYALNVVIRNQKYRWMGHVTLVLTTIYLVVPGHAGMTPAVRIASFLALGAALLAVSLVFTQTHRNGARPGQHPR